LLVGFGSRAVAGRPRWAAVWPATAAVVAGFASTAAAAASLTRAPWIVTLASLIVLLPGLTLTLAMREVATGHLSSGAARMTGAAATFLALGCGIAFADQLGDAWLHAAPGLVAAPAEALPEWTLWLGYAASAVAFVPLFGAPLRDVGWIALGCAASVAGSSLGVTALGPMLAPFAGALAVGVVGNAFARVADRPAAIVTLPGLLLLVPGSLGIRSMSALLADDVVTGIGTAFTVGFVAAALVSGLLFANVVVAPRRASWASADPEPQRDLESDDELEPTDPQGRLAPAGFVDPDLDRPQTAVGYEAAGDLRPRTDPQRRRPRSRARHEQPRRHA
jgi:uncharacterized membrane protein YjjB (DUF3815 family)